MRVHAKPLPADVTRPESAVQLTFGDADPVELSVERAGAMTMLLAGCIVPNPSNKSGAYARMVRAARESREEAGVDTFRFEDGGVLLFVRDVGSFMLDRKAAQQAMLACMQAWTLVRERECADEEPWK